jgi:hypothetical protein
MISAINWGDRMSEYIQELRSLVGTRKNGDELYSVTALYFCNDYKGELVSDSTESHEVSFLDVDDLPNLNPANTIYLAKYLESDLLRRR